MEIGGIKKRFTKSESVKDVTVEQIPFSERRLTAATRAGHRDNAFKTGSKKKMSVNVSKCHLLS
jgi:hypothetical protein